jgi:hypothetical protein
MSGRPRGFILDYNPRTKTLDLLAQVRGVLDTYAAELPLTARQIYYRLVATVAYPKDERGYTRLQEHLANFRRAGKVAFENIRDDGAIIEEPLEYGSPEEFLRIAEDLARQGQGVRLEGQPEWIEIWCEAAGMVPQLARAVGGYGVAVYSSGGFDSLTVKYDAAQRIADRDVPTVVLHIGDFDPSGLALFEAAAEDVEAFVSDAGGDVRFRRVAVTPEQIMRYSLPTAPPKRSDKRSAWTDGNETVQAEALPPDVLAAEVRQAVESELDMDAFEMASETEAANREAIEELLRGLRGDNGAGEDEDE